MSVRNRGIDWVGRWFELLEEQGECLDGHYGHLAPDASVPRWTMLPHSCFDGIAGLAEVMGRAGVTPGALPTLRRRRQPPAIDRWRALARFLAERSRPTASFRRARPGWRPQNTVLSRPSAISWRALTLSETAAIEREAKATNVSTGSLLLHALGRALAHDLDFRAGPALWMIPVNIRGITGRPPRQGNHLSYVTLAVRRSDTPATLHRRLRRCFEASSHWGALYALQIASRFGEGAMRAAQTWDETCGPRYVGTFSNLGAWGGSDGAGSDGDAGAGHWLLCPPTTRFQPFGVGLVTWRGRLGIAAQAHPMLDLRPDQLEAIMDRWLHVAPH